MAPGAVRKPVGTQAVRRAGAFAALCVSLAACTSSPLLAYQPEDPPAVSLPLAAAGVSDARAPFAALFQRELRRQGGDGAVDAWLHGPVPALPEAAFERLDRSFAARRAGTAVLLVPGLFGDCVDDQSVPFGDGVRRDRDDEAVASYAQYADLGLHSVRLAHLPGRGSPQRNGQRLAEAVRALARSDGVRRIVLVAYSKGTTDALHAAAELADTSASVPLALVSVAGVVMGTPLADRYEALYGAVAGRVSPFDCSPSEGGEVAGITRRERVRWMAANPLPAKLARFSVVAHAAPEETAPLLRATQRLLAQVDPRNDGQMIASDAMLPGGALLAEARADHWDVALPRNRHPNPIVRATASGRDYPREALFRALMRWVVAGAP